MLSKTIGITNTRPQKVTSLEGSQDACLNEGVMLRFYDFSLSNLQRLILSRRFAYLIT